jgi:hypothetical protein
MSMSMSKSAKFSFALSSIFALCVVVAIAKTSGNHPTIGKFTNNSILAGKTTSNISQFGDGPPCPCNNVRAGQFCSPNGLLCEPFNDQYQGCGSQGSDPSNPLCGHGKCCTGLILID